VDEISNVLKSSVTFRAIHNNALVNRMQALQGFGKLAHRLGKVAYADNSQADYLLLVTTGKF
jgi:hypothetical protein